MSCRSNNKGSNSSIKPVIEIAHITSKETDAAIVITNVENEKIVVLAEKNSDGDVIKIKGGTYINSENSSFTFWFGDNGLPSIAISEDFIFSFKNYSSDSVDLSVTSPDGTTRVFTNIEVDTERLNELLHSEIAGKISQSNTSQISATIIRTVGVGLSVACCVSGIISSPTGVGVIVAVACCSGSIFGTINLLTDDDMAGVGSLSTSSLTCALGDVGGCAGIGLEAIAREIEKVEEIRITAEEGTAVIIGEISQ